MLIEVVDLSIQRGNDTVTVSGKVRNRNMTAGAPVTLVVTLFGSDGQVIGEFDATTKVGAVDTLTPFQKQVPVTGLIAGWKYSVRKDP
jgi:hypothetical protein